MTGAEELGICMERLAMVIVTYKRQELLERLFASILKLTEAPWRIVVVDNENSERTSGIVKQFGQECTELWGTTEPDEEGGTARVVYFPQTENIGGSGGFSRGVGKAYALGASWFWVMDDDVSVLPDAVTALGKWSKRFGAIQGQRYDADGGHFFWQYRFNTALAIYNPFSPSGWKPGEEYKECNALCFEGGCFSREVVSKIGLPDERFFIYLDDALYGYLANKVTTVALVPDYVVKREREVQNQSIGSVRQLNSTSDMTRYYITRNRGYLARYFQLYGDYSPVGYALGTLLNFAKELIRLLLVDRGHFSSSWSRLWAGYKDSKTILHDKDWKPMPPLA